MGVRGYYVPVCKIRKLWSTTIWNGKISCNCCGVKPTPSGVAGKLATEFVEDISLCTDNEVSTQAELFTLAIAGVFFFENNDIRGSEGNDEIMQPLLPTTSTDFLLDVGEENECENGHCNNTAESKWRFFNLTGLSSVKFP